MVCGKIKPGFATLNVFTQIAGFPETHITLNAYVNGSVKCLPESPNSPCMVEIVIQQKTVWVEADCLTAADSPDVPFDFVFLGTEKTAA